MLRVLEPGFVRHKFQYVGEVKKNFDIATIKEDTRLNGGATCMKKWRVGVGVVVQCNIKCSLLHFERKTPKFMILSEFCVRTSEMTFSSLLILMIFCLFELAVEDAAIQCGVNRRAVAKIRYFIILKLGNIFFNFNICFRK